MAKQMEGTIMDMYSHVQKEMDFCNSMQIQDGELFCSLQWIDGYWKLVGGEMPTEMNEAKGFFNSQLVRFLVNMPHQTKRKGTVLLITGIPLSKKVE